MISKMMEKMTKARFGVPEKSDDPVDQFYLDIVYAVNTTHCPYCFRKLKICSICSLDGREITAAYIVCERCGFNISDASQDELEKFLAGRG